MRHQTVTLTIFRNMSLSKAKNTLLRYFFYLTRLYNPITKISNMKTQKIMPNYELKQLPENP